MAFLEFVIGVSDNCTEWCIMGEADLDGWVSHSEQAGTVQVKLWP